MKPTTVTRSNTRAGVYHLIENFHGNGIIITAQGLLEMARWVEQHRRTLEQETKQEPEHRLKCWAEEAEEYAYYQSEWRE
jgi:hypothetical protein